MQGWSTVKETAEKIGVTEAYVREILNRAQYDRGVRKPNTEILDQICSVLNLKTDDLYNWDINDLALIMDSVVRIFDKILEDEQNVDWRDVLGFSEEEFFDITNYIYNWADSIVEKRKRIPVSKSELRFYSEYIERKIAKLNNKGDE